MTETLLSFSWCIFVWVLSFIKHNLILIEFEIVFKVFILAVMRSQNIIFHKNLTLFKHEKALDECDSLTLKNRFIFCSSFGLIRFIRILYTEAHYQFIVFYVCWAYFHTQDLNRDVLNSFFLHGLWLIQLLYSYAFRLVHSIQLHIAFICFRQYVICFLRFLLGLRGLHCIRSHSHRSIT